MRTFGKVRVTCRERQVKELKQLLALDNKMPANIPVQSVFVFGDSGTGKSFTVNKILSTASSTENPDFNVNVASLNCVEMLQVRSVFSSILNQLTVGELHSFDQLDDLNICDSPADFLRLLVQHLPPEDRLYIAFDNAHRLRDLDPNLFSIFFRLQELSERLVCCIFISGVPLSHFYTTSGFCLPHEVIFPHYTQEELCSVLLECRPAGYDENLYENYLNLVLSFFKNANANVKELQYVASTNFIHYIAPLAEDSLLDERSLKLWHSVEPHLKAALNSLYLREVDASGSEVLSRTENSAEGRKQIIELPFYSKFLLIAAYCASYNPPATDRKFFVKNGGRERRKASQIRKVKPNNHLLGPRPFPLNRLLAIFHAIIHAMDAPLAPTTVLLSQVSSLVHHRLVTQTAAKDALSMPRYKCAVDLDYVTHIANTVKFEIKQHLEDFNM